MAYSKTLWVNNSEPAITAARLNKIENGIAVGHGLAEERPTTEYMQTAIAASALDTIEATEGLISDAIVTANIDLQNAINSGDATLQQNINELSTTVGSNTSAISTLSTTVTSNDISYANQFSTLTSNYNTLNNNVAVIESNLTTQANEVSALSTFVNTISASVSGQESTITEFASTYATQDAVGAIKQVALDVNGNITGWTAANGTYGSSFLIQADQFALTDQTRTTTPFSINTATGQAQFNGTVNFSNLYNVPDYTLSTELTTAISEREQAEAALQTAITEEAAARLEGETVLTQAYQSYINTVKEALIDGEISEAESNAISEAQNRINIAKTEIQTTINSLTTVEDNNDTFAQSLGYASYSDMEIAAAAGTTIISGGYINSGLLSTDALVVKNSAQIGEGVINTLHITDVLQSTNYSTYSGWSISKAGDAVFNDATFRGNIEGSIIEGSTIVTSDIVRATEGGSPYYTEFNSTEYIKTANLSLYYAGGKDGADHRFRGWTGPLDLYGYNWGPTGIETLNRLIGPTLSLSVSGYTNANSRAGVEGDFIVYLCTYSSPTQLASSPNSMTELVGARQYDYNTGTVRTSNGVTLNMGGISFSGTVTLTPSTNEFYGIYVYQKTWRGTYSTGTVGQLTVSAYNHTIST